MSQPSFAELLFGQGVLNLSVIVEWHDGDLLWSETTRLLNVDQHGATFQLQQRPQLGQLVRVTPDPHAFSGRAADAQGDGFWALVWALSEVSGRAARGGATALNIASVLFFGDDVARSFTEDTGADYGYMAEAEGVFRLQRMPRQGQAEEGENRRREARIYLPIEVTAEVLDENGEVVEREFAITENISRRGAALRTTLVVPPEGHVRLTCQQTGFTVTSVVRACRTGADNVGRVHVEFIDGRWPLGDDW
jgi:hypothetical protein